MYSFTCAFASCENFSLALFHFLERSRNVSLKYGLMWFQKKRESIVKERKVVKPFVVMMRIGNIKCVCFFLIFRFPYLLLRFYKLRLFAIFRFTDIVAASFHFIFDWLDEKFCSEKIVRSVFSYPFRAHTWVLLFLLVKRVLSHCESIIKDENALTWVVWAMKAYEIEVDSICDIVSKAISLCQRRTSCEYVFICYRSNIWIIPSFWC